MPEIDYAEAATPEQRARAMTAEDAWRHLGELRKAGAPHHQIVAFKEGTFALRYGRTLDNMPRRV